MSDTTSTTEPKARAAITAGLRALADYLDAHPGLPVPQFSMCAGLTVYPGGSEEDKRAEVDRIAEVLQVRHRGVRGLRGGTAVRRPGRLPRGGGSQRSRRRERHRGAVRP